MTTRFLRFRILSIVLVMLIPLMLCACGFYLSDSQMEELERAAASLHRGRPENAELLPDLSKDISDIRMTIVPREYETPSFYIDMQNLTLLQIWYGYYADNTWYDHPSENYDLFGIMEYSERQGWEAGIGSHIVKIGPYLLICLCLQDDPLVEYQISDTLDTQILQPFEEYHTYHYYYDENGKQHYYMDTHDHGYGYITEDPSALWDTEKAVGITRCEFPRRYYLILDYASIPEDYLLTVSATDIVSDAVETHTLNAAAIHALIDKETD